MWIIKIHMDFAQKKRGFDGVEFGIHTNFKFCKFTNFLNPRVFHQNPWGFSQNPCGFGENKHIWNPRLF